MEYTDEHKKRIKPLITERAKWIVKTGKRPEVMLLPKRLWLFLGKPKRMLSCTVKKGTKKEVDFE